MAKLDETLHTGANTAVQLREQTEQIERIHDVVTETHDTMDRSQYILNGMKSWGGAFMNMFRKPPAPGSSSARSEVHVREPHVPAAAEADRSGANQLNQQSATSRRRAAPISAEDASAEERQDQKLDQIHSHLKILGTMATDMNSELKHQQTLLDDVDSNIDNLDYRIRDQTRQMRRI